MIAYGAAAWIGYQYVWQRVFPFTEPAIVQDNTGILDREQTARIGRYHATLLTDHDIDYRTVVRDDVDGDINVFAHRHFTEHGIGELSESGRGLLLVIDAQNDLVRLEVSQALEGVYTDAFISYIQHRQMIPFFRNERVADGILASTELIVTRAQQASQGRGFLPPMRAGSTGGGAVNQAHIGAGSTERFRRGPEVTAAGNDPRAVLAAYRRAMDRRNGNTELSIYTRETRTFLSRWTLTPAQMDNEAKSLAACPERVLKVAATYAVLRHPVSARQCPPYFFRLEEGEWRLDLAMMSKAIRFNHRNQWHFDAGYGIRSRPYSFAFSDWRIDEHGFPRTEPDLP